MTQGCRRPRRHAKDTCPVYRGDRALLTDREVGRGLPSPWALNAATDGKQWHWEDPRPPAPPSGEGSHTATHDLLPEEEPLRGPPPWAVAPSPQAVNTQQ